MKQQAKKQFLAAICLLTAFAAWTLSLTVIDVQAIAPNGTNVGFATLNQWVHGITGVHMTLYHVTDWLGLVPLAIAFCFAVLGLVQWISRKQISRVDRDILVLGAFYLAVIAVYVLFESVVINYRPVLINGYAEVSYPSSTTLLVLSVIPTTLLQCRTRIKHPLCRRLVLLALSALLAFMVVGRAISGVHWITDIIGGILLSAGLTTAYRAFAEI